MSSTLFPRARSLAILVLGWSHALSGVAAEPAPPPPYDGSREHVGILTTPPPDSYFFDRRSLVKTWIFKDHANTAPEPLVNFAEPLSRYYMVARREARSKETLPPVPVLHMKATGKPARWDIGPLPAGTYMFRIIGAIPAADQALPPKHLVIRFTINDRLDGSNSQYVLRGRGVDNFYCVQEFGFHVVDNRPLVAEVALLEDSETSLYAYNFEIHDLLAGRASRGGKTQPSFFTLEERERARRAWAQTEEGTKMLATIEKEARALAPADRAERDAAIWRSLPEVNNLVSAYYMSFKELSRTAIRWEPMAAPQNSPTPYWMFRRLYGGTYGSNWDRPFALVFDKWAECDRHPYAPEEIFTREDYLAHKPLGKTGDRGWGVRQGDALVAPLARINTLGWETATRMLLPDPMDRYHLGGDEAFARDMALLLVRFAWDSPIFSVRHTVGYITATDDIPWSEDRQYWNVNYRYALAYDKLFPFIKGNQELATAVGKFIPTVKTPEDVIRLLDAHLIQYTVRNLFAMRYYYDNDTADILLTLAVVQANPEVSRPWLEELWERGVYFYPIGRQPLPDALSMSTQRDGSSTIGSIFYTSGGGPSQRVAGLIEHYMRLGGDPRFDLRDFNRYPEAVAGCSWPIEAPVAGLHYLGIGDVGGPSERYGRAAQPEVNARMGWRWTRDPRFAWLLAHVAGRLYESDAEWSEITKAATGLPDPIMGRRSRVLSDWSGILESGVGQPDFRFHRAAAVRVGWGYGHHHNDSLDLRVWAHGLTMLGDMGQRGSYGKPTHGDTMCHNLVQVDEDQQAGHSWVRTLADTAGAQYLHAEAVPVKPGLLRRQTALVDVDEGRPSRGDPPRKDAGALTPNSYVFDVCRTRGGAMHTFCFHGCVDDMHFEINLPEKDRKLFPRDKTPEREALEASDPEAHYLRDFRWTREDYMGKEFRPNDADWAATCGTNVLQATWRLSRSAEERMVKGERGLGGALTAPRKFTRLHLFDTSGLRVLHGIVLDKVNAAQINPDYPHYAGRCLYVRKPVSESVFVSLVEPFAGDAFITSQRRLRVEPADGGVDGPVAVEAVVNVRDDKGPVSRIDLLYADNTGAPHAIPEAGVQAQGEFALVQRLNRATAHAVLVRGTALKADDFEMTCERAEYRIPIRKVNYVTREVTLDGQVPAALFKGATVEIGDKLRCTSYEVGDAFDRDGATVLKLPKSLELKRTRVRGVRPTGNSTEIETSVNIMDEPGVWAANGDYSQTWRVAGKAGDPRLTLVGAAKTSDFEGAKEGILTLEIGPGQEVVLPARASATLQQNGAFAIAANVNGRWRARGGAWQNFAASAR